MRPVPQSLPRGTCTVCGKNIRIRQDGTLFYHGGYQGVGWCRGMHKPPVDGTVSKP